ncbi:MAG TPA: hypothetical protein VFX30_02950, partial [bacterium]|nr:hypothetical protein [bacterium]
TSRKDSRIENIWTAAADGSAAKPLTRMTRPNTDCGGAEWSPDGSRILFLSLRALDGSDTINEEDALNLWIMDADGSNPRVVARFEDPDTSPSSAEWLPGGKGIVFHAPGKDEGSLPELGYYWVLNDDGAERSPLSRDLPVLHCLRGLEISPDGRKFLCESFDSPLRKQKGRETLWLYDRDANAQSPLTQDVKEEASRDPRWSPDGKLIAFSRHTVGFLDGSADRLWIMDAEGKNAKALTGR